MERAARKSHKGFGFLFVMNWDTLLFFGVTALAMLAGSVLITI